MYTTFAVAKRTSEFAVAKREPEKNQACTGAHDVCDTGAVVVF